MMIKRIECMAILFGLIKKAQKAGILPRERKELMRELQKLASEYMYVAESEIDYAFGGLGEGVRE
jgi:hypothetical protein